MKWVEKLKIPVRVDCYFPFVCFVAKCDQLQSECDKKEENACKRIKVRLGTGYHTKNV